MHFGRIDRTDFLIPPFAIFYFYTVFAVLFNLPIVSHQVFFQFETVSWAWRAPVPGRIGAYALESRVFRPKFSRWYRC